MKKNKLTAIITATMVTAAMATSSIANANDVATVAETSNTSEIQFGTYDTTVYDEDTFGYTRSCYDVNRDGNVSVFDLVLMKKFLLNQPDQSTPEYALDNAEVFSHYLESVESYLAEANPEWYAKVNNIRLDALQRPSGYLEHETFLFTVTFAEVLDKDGVGTLCNYWNDEEELEAYAGTTDTIRIVVGGNGKVRASVPVHDGEFSVSYALDTPEDDGESFCKMEIDNFLLEQSPYWYSLVNSIDINLNGEGNGTATVVFDRVLDENAVGLLLRPDDFESEVQYVTENGLHKIRMTIEGYGDITAVSAVS